MPPSRGPTTMSSFHDRMDDVVDWAANHFIQKGKADSFVTWSSSITNLEGIFLYFYTFTL